MSRALGLIVLIVAASTAACQERGAPAPAAVAETTISQAAGTCGNGDVEDIEVCDDGNGTNGDGCDNNCTPTGCGNGIETAGEECDVGLEDTDKCDAQFCRDRRCGDGYINEAVEECDDNNNRSNDNCRGNCRKGEGCGDGTLEAPEECDTSGESATCDSNCTAVFCGDGTTNEAAGELCDDGGGTADGGVIVVPRDSQACDADCTPRVCGDAHVNATAGEQCDDGNTTSTDACTHLCRVAVCGDGIIRAGVETCDDGNTDDGDGCSATCQNEASPEGCGDGTVGGAEECDDGNTANGDGCSAVCTVEEGGPSNPEDGDATGGCCSTSGSGSEDAAAALALSALVGLVTVRRRRRADRRPQL